MCETDNLRISSVSRLLSHSGLIGPRGAYTHTHLWFMQSQYTPTHLSIHPPFLTSSWCCYSMVAFQIVRQWHSLGAHQKANEMLVNLSTVAEMWTWSVWHNETVRIASPTGIYTLVKFHAALKKKLKKKIVSQQLKQQDTVKKKKETHLPLYTNRSVYTLYAAKAIS